MDECKSLDDGAREHVAELRARMAATDLVGRCNFKGPTNRAGSAWQPGNHPCRKYHRLRSCFAFNFKLRHYELEVADLEEALGAQSRTAAAAAWRMVARAGVERHRAAGSRAKLRLGLQAVARHFIDTGFEPTFSTLHGNLDLAL